MKKRQKKKKMSPATETGKRKKRIPKKKLLILFGSLIFFFSVYQIAIYFELIFILHTYCIAAGLLFVIYIIINRGMLTPPDKNTLPEDWSEEKKDSFVSEQIERRRKSSVLLYFLIPIILTVVYDMIYIYLTVNMGLNL